MEIDNILDVVTDTATVVFRNSYIRHGYAPTGAAYRSIQRNRHKVQISIAVATLIWGRRPGRFPPWGYQHGSQNRSSLMQWAMDKFQVDEKSAKSISYLIARKLKTYGNDVYRGLKAPIEIIPAQEAAVEQFNQLIKLNYYELINKK